MAGIKCEKSGNKTEQEWWEKERERERERKVNK